MSTNQASNVSSISVRVMLPSLTVCYLAIQGHLFLSTSQDNKHDQGNEIPLRSNIREYKIKALAPITGMKRATIFFHFLKKIEKRVNLHLENKKRRRRRREKGREKNSQRSYNE